MSITEVSQTYRATHSYPGALYLLPSDDDEKERLARQHQLYKTLFGGRIIFPAISFPPNAEVLDIGTGSATWLTDCRSHLPDSVQFYGTDIESKLFPAYSITPPNSHFSIGSATRPPSYWSSKFTLVNQRLLILALTKEEWNKVVHEIYRVLKDGGYAQFVEIDSTWFSGPKTAAHVKFLNEFLEAKGLDLQCCDHIPELMATAGFVDIYTEEVIVQIGKWAGQIGQEARDASIGALRGMKGPVMKAGGMGYVASAEEFDKKMDEVADEWDRTEGSYRKLKAGGMIPKVRRHHACHIWDVFVIWKQGLPSVAEVKTGRRISLNVPHDVSGGLDSRLREWHRPGYEDMLLVHCCV